MVRSNTSPRRPRRTNSRSAAPSSVYGYGWPTEDTDTDTYADNSGTCDDTAPADTTGGCSGGEG
jgi:hypothetical protein